MRIALSLVVMLGCVQERESARDDPSATTVQVVRAPAPSPPRSQALQVIWQDVESTRGCFFFSGPFGRDDQLVGTATVERKGAELTLTLNGVVFRGALSSTGFLLTRHSHHDYGGPWDVDETIHGQAFEGSVRAVYRYHECEMGTTCPGTCTIKGTLVLGR